MLVASRRPADLLDTRGRAIIIVVTCVISTARRLDPYVVDLLRISLDRGHFVVDALDLIDLESGVTRLRGSLLLARLREGGRPEKR